MNDIIQMMANGEILGFKRTSTFALWGTMTHTSASYDVFVDDGSMPVDAASIKEKVAGDLNTDPHYLRIVPVMMCDGDYPESTKTA